MVYLPSAPIINKYMDYTVNPDGTITQIVKVDLSDITSQIQNLETNIQNNNENIATLQTQNDTDTKQLTSLQAIVAQAQSIKSP